MKDQKFYEREVDKLFKHIKDLKDTSYHYYIYKWTLKRTKPNDLVLDVGCGIGTMCHLLKEAGRNVTGVDITDKSVEICKKNVPGGVFKRMDAYNLEFQDCIFDVVVSNQFIEHIDDPSKAIKEMVRVVKPGGIVVITTPIKDMLNASCDEGHVQSFDYYQLMHLFEEFGLDFKIYWLNKYTHFEVLTREPSEKNCFGIVWRKNGNKDKR